jgi:hypothetical protein
MVLEGTAFALRKVSDNLYKFERSLLSSDTSYVTGTLETASGRLMYEQVSTDDPPASRSKWSTTAQCGKYL